MQDWIDLFYDTYLQLSAFEVFGITVAGVIVLVVALNIFVGLWRSRT